MDNINLDRDKVSIITPVYNCERFLKSTINCVLDQTYSNWELLLVDDCSKDGSSDIAIEYSNKDERIKYIKLDTNGGAAIARNTALEHSTGRFVAYLDSDDLWKPEKLEKQINFMMNHKYGFTCTDYEKIDENDNQLKIVKMPESIDYEHLLRNTIVQTSGVMIDTEIIDRKLLIMPNIRRRQDSATWAQILKVGNYCYGMPENLSYYRVVKNSLSSNKFKAIKMNIYWYRKIEKLSIIKTAYCFVGYAWNACKKRIYIGGNEE